MNPFSSPRLWSLVQKLSWVLPLIGYACILQPRDENFVDVDPEPDPKYVGTLTYSYEGNGTYYPATDTFWLPSDQNLYFKFAGGQIFKSEIKVGERVFSQQGSLLTLDGEVFANGSINSFFAMKITQVTKSGTQSLADKFNVEGAAFSRTFVLSTSDFGYKPVITNVQIKDGTVEVKWNPYPHSDFQSYEIRRYGAYTGPYDPYKKFTVTDRTETTFRDSTYLGGGNYVLLINRGGKYFRSDAFKFYTAYQPNLRLTKLENGQAQLSWILPPYYKSIQSISVSVDGGGQSTSVAEHLPGTQTSVTFDFAKEFGQITNFYFRLYTQKAPNDNEQPYAYYSTELTFGTQVPPPTGIVYCQPEESYYVLFESQYYNTYPTGVYKLDKDLSPTDTLVDGNFYTNYTKLIQSPNAQHTYLLNDNELIRLQTSPLAIESRYNTRSHFENIGNFAVSNNNFILYCNGNGPYHMVVFDFAKEKELIRVPARSAAHLSADGKYFANGSDLYRFNGTQYNLTKTLPFTDIQFMYFTHPEPRLMIATKDKVIWYDYVNEAIVAEYSFSVPHAREFNELTMNYTASDIENRWALNIATGELQREPVYQAYNSKTAGEYIFAAQGFAIKAF